MGSLDDLDRLLAEELAAGQSLQQRVSLEEQVLSRVNLTEKQQRLEVSAAETSSAGTPLERFLDKLIPFLEELQQHLRTSEPLQETFASMRSRLAEELISLPEVEGIEKAGVFAAVASCLDAGISGRPQRVLAAQERISRLLARVESIRDESLQRRMLAAEEFVQHEGIDLEESP